MAEADSQIANPSVRGVPISDRITERIALHHPECPNGRAITGAAKVYAFSLLPLDTARHSPKSQVI
jgi:hypothetical protein